MTMEQYETARLDGRVNFRSFAEMVQHPASILTQEGWWGINNTHREIIETYPDLDTPMLRPEGSQAVIDQHLRWGQQGEL